MMWRRSTPLCGSRVPAASGRRCTWRIWTSPSHGRLPSMPTSTATASFTSAALRRPGPVRGRMKQSWRRTAWGGGGVGLGAFGIHTETPRDLEEALEMLQPKGLVALAVDTLSAYESAVRVDVIGSDRLPDAKIDGERAKALWGQIKIKTRAGVVASRHAARYVVWSAPFDRSEDPFGGPGRFLSPNLIGKSCERNRP